MFPPSKALAPPNPYNISLKSTDFNPKNIFFYFKIS